MLQAIAYLLVFSLPIIAMQPELGQLVKVYASDDRGERVLEFLPLQSALQCSTIAQSIEFCSPNRYSFFVSSQFACPALWHKLKPCLEKPHEVKSMLQSQRDLGEVLNAANYLGHEGLFHACLSEWIERDYEADPSLHFPAEVEGAISHEILIRGNVHSQLVRYGTQETNVACEKFRHKNARDVWSCAVANDGQSVAAGYASGDIYYWIKNDNAWKRYKIRNAHEGKSIGRMQFADGNKKLISSGNAKGIKVWDLQNRVCLLVFEDTQQDGFFSEYDDVHELLAIPTKEFGIHVYSLKPVQLHAQAADMHMNPVIQLEGHFDKINALDFASTGDLLAWVADDCFCMVWDLTSQEPIRALMLPACALSVKFNHQGNLLALGLDHGILQIYDTAAGSIVSDRQDAHRARIWRCLFSKDDSLIMTGSEDRMIKIWASQPLECLRVINRGMGKIFFMDQDLLHDKLVAGFSNGSICLFDLGELIKEIRKQRLELKYGLSIEQARFLVHAAQATPKKKLICTGERARIFNSFNQETRAILLKNFSLLVPDERDAAEPVIKKLKIKRPSK